MLRLENWADLFKFNKTLLDDDFNRDQSLVVKAKTVSLDGCSVNIKATPLLNINDLFTKHNRNYNRNLQLPTSRVFPTRTTIARFSWRQSLRLNPEAPPMKVPSSRMVHTPSRSRVTS